MLPKDFLWTHAEIAQDTIGHWLVVGSARVGGVVHDGSAWYVTTCEQVNGGRWQLQPCADRLRGMCEVERWALENARALRELAPLVLDGD